jgi:hypothetical protein
MRLSPSGPVGQAVIAKLRENSCDVALVLLHHMGHERSARAVLVEGGEAAWARFEELNKGKWFEGGEVKSRFEEMMLEVKSEREWAALSTVSADGSRPKKPRAGL